MKTETLALKSWDDLVFENRNHEYGAYVIRKSYSDNLLSGVFLSVFLASLVLLVPLLSSFKGKEVVGNDPEGKEPIILTDLPFIEVLPPPVVSPPTAPVVAANINLPPRVTTDPTDVEVLTNDQVAASLPSTDGLEGGVSTTTTDAGTIEIPAVVEPTVFTLVEVMPAYEGGLEAMYKFIQKKIRYPSVPRRMGLGGTVIVSFVVDADGGIADVRVLRGVHIDLDKEACRVIAMLPAWKAGRQRDRNVAVRMTLPIKFQFNNN